MITFSLQFLRWCRYTQVAGGLHLELVQGLAGAGNHRLIGIGVLGTRHNGASPFVANLLDSENPNIALPQPGFLCAPFFAESDRV